MNNLISLDLLITLAIEYGILRSSNEYRHMNAFERGRFLRQMEREYGFYTAYAD